MVLGFHEMLEVIKRCSRDFNGLYELRFLYDSGGWGEQKYLRCEMDDYIIGKLNKYAMDKRKD